ncbi:neo-calmodulin-like [Tubulanus polymorphus]|uniref:neo-calmodulin-like n=1 Tax=Tubulanus polymorphus TaxID=672921 RepID=UPI003DA3EEB1
MAIPDDDSDCMREAFEMFDRNGDGHVNAYELRTVMQSLGMNPTIADIKASLDAYDIDGNGKIEFNEFVKMLEDIQNKHPDPDAELNAAFKIFDRDGNGKICAAELKYVMKQIGEKLTDDEVKLMLDCADIDKDGFINKEEFCVMMKGTGVFKSSKSSKSSKSTKSRKT